MDKKIEVAVEKCTDNFMLTYCSECPRKQLYGETKICRDELILTLYKENERLEKENLEYSNLVSELVKENAVSLTEEEYIRWQSQTLNIKHIRKETAEEILVPLLKICTFEDNETALDDKVVELAERYGIEVEQ